MKPAALLQHSKKKKGPARLSAGTIVMVGVVVILLMMSVIAMHRYKSGGNIDRTAIQENVGVVDVKVVDENSDDKTGLDGSVFPRYATLNTTKGFITLELFGKQTPLTVENFITHSKNGYYNGVLFHRVIKDFIIQSGDPKGDGKGGESIWGGSFRDELSKELIHEPFTLSMANIGERNSNRSQFFITTIATPHLDMKHTVFGRVVRGKDVVQAIESVETDDKDRPLTPIYIHDIKIHDEL
jgi:peptidylprolyl isomerase domain and WD repeat-containing protein 1